MFPNHWKCQGRALLVAALLCLAPAAHAQTFTADFSRWSGPPLVKKFGVYQTPLISRERLMASLPLLDEIGARDLRYEIAWGKPDALASDQISGTAADPQLDFSFLDEFLGRLRVLDVHPLLALTYCPNPLKSRTEWSAWRDMPSSLPAWSQIVQRYATHLHQADGLRGSFYEVWNEPDIPEPHGKIFFNGNPADYHRLYAATAPAVHGGDPDALVGGAAIAYDFRYFTPILSEPLDFASLHAYNNYPGQVNAMRGALAGRPDLPIFLTEYASFTDFGKTAPDSRSPAAERFFRDAKGMVAFPDLVKVYWAQWVDDGLGMLTGDLHRKALFNAFKIYGELPVDRCAVTPDAADGVGVLASADDHNAGIVLWNEDTSPRTVTVHLTHLPFPSGAMQVFRIDPDHASYVDNPASEDLRPLETQAIGKLGTWHGSIPGESVVYLKAFDGSRQSLLASSHLGDSVRTEHWFFDRTRPMYADFDPRTSIARLGMGDQDFGVAQTAAVIDNPPLRLRVQVKKSGPFAAHDANSLFALRLDFRSRSRRYSRSVLYHNGLYDARRNSVLPWGKAGVTADVVRVQAAMNTGRPFLLDLARLAPADWDHRRILLSFILQNAGRDSQARVILRGGDAALSRPRH